MIAFVINKQLLKNCQYMSFYAALFCSYITTMVTIMHPPKTLVTNQVGRNLVASTLRNSLSVDFIANMSRFFSFVKEEEKTKIVC